MITFCCFTLCRVLRVIIPLLSALCTLTYISYILIMPLYGNIAHDGLGRMTEHLRNVEVERTHAVALLEREVRIASGLAHHIHRGTLALGDAAHLLDVLLVDEQSHALLALVGYYLLGAQCLVADGQLCHVDASATFLHQFRETVQVAGRTVVVDAHHRIHVALAERTHQVVGTLLHLGIGTLHGVQLDAVAVAAGVYRRYRASAQSDAVVVATHYDHFVALGGLFLQAVALGAVAHAAGQHYHFVVGILGIRVQVRVRVPSVE